MTDNENNKIDVASYATAEYIDTGVEGSGTCDVPYNGGRYHFTDHSGARVRDSGERREFDSGAVRDISEGKGRCDLLPLNVASALLMDDPILTKLDEYVRTGNLMLIAGVIDVFIQRYFKGIKTTALLEVSKHYEDGASKYSERNWEKGIPLHCYIDSGVRHYLKFLRGDKDERHDRAFLWNMMGLMWTANNFANNREFRSKIFDLPFETDKKKE